MVAERTELAVVDGAANEYNAQQRAIIKQTVAKDCTEAEFGLFLEVCKSTGLNPFARQIYAIKRGGGMTIQTGIDGYRVLAERSGKYAGQVGPFWCGPDGAWRDVWLDVAAPVACKIGVLRRDFAEPLWAVARTAAYQQASNALWKTMPDVMIAKCAEALALRKAFPEHITNVYTADEMEQADNPPMPYVEQAAPPAAPATASAKHTLGQKLDQALRNVEITEALTQLGQTSENEQRAHLMATFNTIRAGGGDVTSASVLASLRSQIETAQAAFPLEALETGASGN